jgi:hypothetical protein
VPALSHLLRYQDAKGGQVMRQQGRSAKTGKFVSAAYVQKASGYDSFRNTQGNSNKEEQVTETINKHKQGEFDEESVHRQRQTENLRIVFVRVAK